VKIYTRTGDTGETSLYSGGRVTKDHPRVEAYGTVDELNALLGLLRSEQIPEEIDGLVVELQHSLFSIGSVLADPRGKTGFDSSSWEAEALERWIDRLDAELDALSQFILPGGTRAAALAHLVRAVCRRAERRVLALERAQAEVPEGVIPYLNRLSDLAFVLSRWLNARSGVAELPWTAPRGDAPEE
jgi:cob(I)alamin adenosyltransferase